MSDKPLHIVLLDLFVAAAAVAGIFITLKVFQIPNCTAVGKHTSLILAPQLSLALLAVAVVEFVVGRREESQLSKAIALLSLLASALIWVTCKWKLNSIATLAC